MKKKSILYSDLSAKELQHLKEIYIEKKVNSMSSKELKEFVLEIISHQITDTIGKEEEMEAWTEMSIFFKEEFDNIVACVQKKFEDDRNLDGEMIDPKLNRIELLERNNIEPEKKDMWDD